MVHVTAQVRLELAKVFHQPEESADQRVSRRALHVRTVLDLFVRDGACVLAQESNTCSFNRRKAFCGEGSNLRETWAK